MPRKKTPCNNMVALRPAASVCPQRSLSQRARSTDRPRRDDGAALLWPRASPPDQPPSSPGDFCLGSCSPSSSHSREGGLHAGRSLGGQHLPGAMGVWGLTSLCNDRAAAASESVNLTALSREQVCLPGCAHAKTCRSSREDLLPATRNVLSLGAVTGCNWGTRPDADRRRHWILPQVFRGHLPGLVRVLTRLCYMYAGHAPLIVCTASRHLHDLKSMPSAHNCRPMSCMLTHPYPPCWAGSGRSAETTQPLQLRSRTMYCAFDLAGSSFWLPWTRPRARMRTTTRSRGSCYDVFSSVARQSGQVRMGGLRGKVAPVRDTPFICRRLSGRPARWGMQMVPHTGMRAYVLALA